MTTCDDLGIEAVAAPHTPGFMDDGEDGFDIVLLEEVGMEAGVDVSDEEARDDLGGGGFAHYKQRAREKDVRSQRFPYPPDLMLFSRSF